MRSEQSASESTGLAIHLLGRPRIELHGAGSYSFRSRKSWALLAFLILAERPQPRSRLAGLLFAEADDPLRALRWCLTEVRRGLGPGAVVDGDPVQLVLPVGTTVDIEVLADGRWTDAVELPGLGHELLDGLAIAHAEPFEAWLLSERRRLSAATESTLRDAALGMLARGDLDRARDLAVQATVSSPWDEELQALLIRVYRLSGDDVAAQRQFDAWSTTARRDLGSTPGAAVLMAMQEQARPDLCQGSASIAAVREGGAAAVAAGALAAGISSFEAAVRLADLCGTDRDRVETRLSLGEALIHTQGDLAETGSATLAEAEAIALSSGDLEAASRVRAELGLLDFRRGRYDRSERRLERVLSSPDASRGTQVKAMIYLGSAASDRADYARASALLDEARTAAVELGSHRDEVFSLSMLGRIELLRGRLGAAEDHLRAAVELAQREHWFSFLPWPQALLGHVLLAQDDLDGAAQCLEQARARAHQLNDPCWEGAAARGLALVQAARGDTDGALEALLDARVLSSRSADPYVWLDVYILDALCEIGVRQGHVLTPTWVEEMHERASRTGMRELTVRAMAHRARLGSPGDAEAAGMLAGAIDNPEVARLLSAVGAERSGRLVGARRSG